MIKQYTYVEVERFCVRISHAYSSGSFVFKHCGNLGAAKKQAKRAENHFNLKTGRKTKAEIIKYKKTYILEEDYINDGSRVHL